MFICFCLFLYCLWEKFRFHLFAALGADIANVINEAAIWAATLQRKYVILDDVDHALQKILAGSLLTVVSFDNTVSFQVRKSGVGCWWKRSVRLSRTTSRVTRWSDGF